MTKSQPLIRSLRANADCATCRPASQFIDAVANDPARKARDRGRPRQPKLPWDGSNSLSLLTNLSVDGGDDLIDIAAAGDGRDLCHGRCIGFLGEDAVVD